MCVQAVRGLLDNPNEPVNELSYFDCIESVMENSKVQAFKIIAWTLYFNCQKYFYAQQAAEDWICASISKWLRSLESRWQAFLSTVRQVMWQPSERAWAWRPKLCVGWQRLQDRWDHRATITLSYHASTLILCLPVFWYIFGFKRGKTKLLSIFKVYTSL